MDRDLEIACFVVEEANGKLLDLSFESDLFHVEHVPGSYTAVMLGDRIMWDNEDNRYEDCDGSKDSVALHVNKRMFELAAELAAVKDAITGRQVKIQEAKERSG